MLNKKDTISTISYFDLTVISTVLYSGRHKLLMYCIPIIQKRNHYYHLVSVHDIKHT